MKKFCISFILIAILIVAVFLGMETKTADTKYLRIHIRANSNSEVDQTVKYCVKDAVVEYLTPKLLDVKTKEDAKSVLTSSLKGIENVANNALKVNGFNYKASAKINVEDFPTRFYGDYCLEAGYYDALIISLGEGVGDNWWCVVYPPLCFVGETSNYVYKSKLLEIINSFKYKEEK